VIKSLPYKQAKPWYHRPRLFSCFLQLDVFRIFDVQAPYLLLPNRLVEPEDARSPGNPNRQTLPVDFGTTDRETLTGLGGIKLIDLLILKRLREHRERFRLASGVADDLNQSPILIFLVELAREVILVTLPDGREAEEITVQRIGCGTLEQLVPVGSDAENGFLFAGLHGECRYRTEGAVTGIGIEGMNRRLALVIASVLIVPGLGCSAEIGRPLKPGLPERLLDRVFSVSVICIFMPGYDFRQFSCPNDRKRSGTGLPKKFRRSSLKSRNAP